MLWNNECTREVERKGKVGVGAQKFPNTVLYRSYLQQSAASAALQKVPLEQMASSLMDYFRGQDYTSIPTCK